MTLMSESFGLMYAVPKDLCRQCGDLLSQASNNGRQESVVLHGDLGLVADLMKRTRHEDDWNNEFIYLTLSAHIFF